MVARAIEKQVFSSEIFEMMSEKKQSRIEGTNNTVSKSEDIPAIDRYKETASTLEGFFKSKGLKVVDKRPNGGCLWVIGSEREIGPIIMEACEQFHICGQYTSGRATGQTQSWFTKSQK